MLQNQLDRPFSQLAYQKDSSEQRPSPMYHHSGVGSKYQIKKIFISIINPIISNGSEKLHLSILSFFSIK